MIIKKIEEIEPTREVPYHLKNQYTLNGKIPIINYYFNDVNTFVVNGVVNVKNDYEDFYTEENVNQLIEKAKKREIISYEKTDSFLYEALDKYQIKDKKVIIVGSQMPSYESICLAYDGIPITIDYAKKRFNEKLSQQHFKNGKITHTTNKYIKPHPKLLFFTVNELNDIMKANMFDFAFSISSVEHDGLGRYGDPLDPYADIISMKKLKTMMKKDGLLFLSVPIGVDILYWNAMRQYGRVRFPMLIEGWEIVDSFGFKDSDFDKVYNRYYHVPAKQFRWNYHQCVFVLKNS